MSSSGRHGRQNIINNDGIHSIVALSYANSTARLAATGFQDYDVNKIAEQTSDNTLWRLISISPITWQALATGTGTGTLSETLANGNTTDGYDIVVSTGDVLTITDNPTVATDAVNKSYADANVLGSFIGTLPANGQILYNDGSNWTVLAAGEDGYVLTTHSTVSPPEWTEPPSSTPTGPAGGDLSGTYPNPTVTDLTITSEQQGSILYRNASNWVQLAPSTDGYVLTTHSTGVDPTWTILPPTTPSGPAGGDLSGTYPNPQIASNVIVNADVNSAAAIDFTKLATITTDSLLGRDTASTGALEVITLGASLSMTGAQVLQRAAISGDITIAVNSNTSAITAGVILNADINASAGIVLSKLATQAALSVVANGTNSTAVPTAIAASTDGYVFARSGTTLAFVPVGTANITDNSITLAKIQTIVTDSLLGRDTAGTGNVENILLNATLSMDGSGNLQRAALTGDVTATAGSNTTVIANDAITTVKILNNNVTVAKMQQITTDSLLGRDTAATGNVEVITLDTTLAMNGSQVLGRAAISGDITIAAASNTAAITAGVIVNADINASAAIDLSKLATQAALSAVINATNGSAVPTAVAGTADQVLRVNTAGTSLGFGTIATAGIADGSITMAKLANLAGISVIGRSANTTGVPAAITATTTGQVLIYNGSTIGFGSPDFGALDITTTGDLILGTTPATTGDIRVNQGFNMAGRNAINNANAAVLRFGTTADTTILGTTSTGYNTEVTGDLVTVRSAQTIPIVINGTNELTISSTAIDAQNNNITTTGNILLGSDPADAGRIRLSNTDAINWENATPGTDILGLTVDSSNNLTLGNVSDTAILLNDSTDLIVLRTGGSAIAQIYAAGFEMFQPTVKFDSTVVSPLITQETDATNGITADTLTVSAQTASGTTTTGGGLDLRSGDGTTIAGNVNIRTGATARVTITPTVISLGNATLRFDETQVNPTIQQFADSTNSITADTLTVNAQNATGTTATGGKLLLASGTGTSRDGYVEIDRGTTKIFESTNLGTSVGDGYIMLEAIQLSTRRVTSLNRAAASAITSTELPTNSGDGVTFLAARQTAPTASPVGGLVMYSTSKGELVTYSSTTATTPSTMYLGDGTNGVTLQAGGATQENILFSVSMSGTPGTHQLSNSAFNANNAGSGSLTTFSFSLYNSGNMITLSNIAGVTNIGLLNTSSGSFGSGNGVIFIANATTVPSTNPTGGAIMFSANGQTFVRNTSGIISTIG